MYESCLFLELCIVARKNDIMFFTYLEAAGMVPWSHRGLKNQSANRIMVGDISSASSALYSLPNDRNHEVWSDPMLIQVFPCMILFMNHEVWSDPMLIQVFPCTSLFMNCEDNTHRPLHLGVERIKHIELHGHQLVRSLVATRVKSQGMMLVST